MDPFLFNGVNKFIEGATEGPIKTFNKTWELVFGGFHLYTDKIQFKREEVLKYLKSNLKMKSHLYQKKIYKNHKYLY